MKDHERAAVVARAKQLFESEKRPESMEEKPWVESLYERALKEIRAEQGQAFAEFLASRNKVKEGA